MSKRKGARVTGPYPHPRKGFVVVEFAADRTRSSSVFDTEQQAQRYIEMMQAELAHGEMTTETALAEYKKHLEAKGNKTDSVRQTTWAIGMFFPEAIPLSLLSTKRCQSLYDALRARKTKHDEPISVDSHRGILAQSRSFLQWCIGKAWLRENPLTGVHGVGKRRPRGKSLGKDGVELRTIRDARAWYATALFKGARGDEGAIAALTAMLLGMRASEITSLKVGDLDEDKAPGDVLIITDSKTEAGKRRLRVPAPLQPLLVHCCEGKKPDRYIFEGDDGKAHWRDWIRKNVRRICGLAEVPKVTAHAMRGLLATIAYEQGVVGEVVAAHLGHEEERTSATSYAAPGAVAAGVNRRGFEVLNGGLLNTPKGSK